MANLFCLLCRHAALILLCLGVCAACFAATYFWGGDRNSIGDSVRAANDEGSTILGNAVVFLPHPSTFEEATEDFHYTFRFQNRGNSTITIREIKPSCACTTVDPSKRTYRPGEEGDIPLSIDMRRQRREAKGFAIIVKYQDQEGRDDEARTTFIVNHNPDIIVSPNPVSIQLTPGEHRTAEVVVMDYHTKAVALGEPHVSSSRIKVVSVERPSVYLPGWRHVYEVSTSGEGLAPGNYRDEVVVKTNDTKKAEIRIAVSLTIVPRIRVAPDPLYLKPSANGEECVGQLYLSDAQGGRVELDGIDVGGHPFTWSVREDSKKRVITLVVDRRKVGPTGLISITLRITKPCPQLIPVEIRW